jgi:flagellar basal-body rod protein FlgB
MIDQLLARENYELAKRLLDAAALRHEALATNLANIETPGFKRLDLAPDFERQLENYASASDPAAALETLQPKLAQDLTARAVRPDGNNIQLDRELLEMNRNALEYDMLTQFASDSLKRLKSAITGRVV